MRVEAIRMPYLGEKPAKVGRELIFCPKTCNSHWLDGKEPEIFNIYSYFDPWYYDGFFLQISLLF